MVVTGPGDKPRQSLRERNRLQTREAILRAAQVLMMRDGAAATSMVEVAELAGVSDTTVYNYFTTKNDLLNGVAEELNSATQFLSLLATRPADEGPFTALRQLMREETERDEPFDAAESRRYLDAVRSDAALWGAYLRVAYDTGEILADAFAARVPAWSRLDAQMAAHATVAALHELVVRAAEGWTRADLGDHADSLLARLERAWPM